MEPGLVAATSRRHADNVRITSQILPQYNYIFVLGEGGTTGCFKCINTIYGRFLERRICNPLDYVADRFEEIKGLRTALFCQC